MPEVKIVNLTKKFKSLKGDGIITALDRVNLTIENKKYNTLLGPSGCGKTTLLKSIAGLLEPTSGEIFFDGKEMTDVPTQDRNVGFVFQNFAIFPHLDVWHNVSYGPLVKGWSEEEIRKTTEGNLKMVGLWERANAVPSELSGGMQQRLGLARALATRSELLLLDEPLSALDTKTGTSLRYKLKQIVKKHKLTAIHVTHNQEEAMTVSDNIILMKKGKIIQTGSPEEIYNKPKSIFAADFLGKCNFFKSHKISNYQVCFHGKKIKVAEKIESKNVILGVRPEKIHLETKMNNKLISGKIELINFLGHLFEYRIHVNGGTVVAYKRIKERKIKKMFRVGERVSFWFNPEDVLIFKEPKDLEEELSPE
jgi:ABC-type Fe3+/spermidine/putrescine transport system ATPase subunit